MPNLEKRQQYVSVIKTHLYFFCTFIGSNVTVVFPGLAGASRWGGGVVLAAVFGDSMTLDRLPACHALVLGPVVPGLEWAYPADNTTMVVAAND